MQGTAHFNGRRDNKVVKEITTLLSIANFMALDEDHSDNLNNWCICGNSDVSGVSFWLLDGCFSICYATGDQERKN